MISRQAAIIGGLAAIAALTIWVLFAGLPRWYGRSSARSGTVAPATTAPPGRKIKASLFYVSDDGLRLTPIERDVAFGEGTVEQARQIVEAQIAPVAEPLVSAVPAGTKLRTIFVTPNGDAFVDFSRELVTGHSGGSTNELLTVYSIVNALCANLPAVHSVELLVDGKQVETLAGHVDLRRPLEKNLTWVQ
ncbi:MAG: GerMN domain-containing protein [Acidobacteriota bacterium]